MIVCGGWKVGCFVVELGCLGGVCGYVRVKEVEGEKGGMGWVRRGVEDWMRGIGVMILVFCWR